MLRVAKGTLRENVILLRDFVRYFFRLQGVPGTMLYHTVAQLRLQKGQSINGIELSNIHAIVVNWQRTWWKGL
jgi:hypothetical protein